MSGVRVPHRPLAFFSGKTCLSPLGLQA
ncbi:hypothetical protein DSM3645_03243 [Blastopirellula marina DSM 3645]|uniref:Uncharacterized protein n=1 Tax=Blastopirellula marina DSM 3645 TaxID=314230 RepID=A3ZVW2_9BACT|nr:hypothetical protein DSM3645_03243 [Blastopirellula marina DSM 3645]